ncbi:hypothetical protein PGT21_026787 [Puccinia graminis f. sp. tritici]|uniref:Uncharacterized protein n=1 Tax=Puccinia graminis f. sp. tritici TaxID=56615 RepID=A0A5B0MFT5_PUCGR|nr:hypothetical protein PGT21_026787 [Puccinia graminis f. sp. tritici]
MQRYCIERGKIICSITSSILLRLRTWVDIFLSSQSDIMTHPCWVIEMIILGLSLLNTTLAGPPRPASTSKFKASQFSKGQHSGLKRPCSIQTDESETQLTRCAKRRKLYSKEDINSITPIPSSSNFNNERTKDRILEFKPEGTRLIHYAWISTLHYPEAPAESANVVQKIFYRAWKEINPDKTLRQIIKQTFASDDNFITQISRIYLVEPEQTTHRITGLFKGICSFNFAFALDFEHIDSNIIHKEQARIFQHFMEFLHDLNKICPSDITTPNNLPTCSRLIIEYFISGEKDCLELNLKSSETSAQEGWMVQLCKHGSFHLVSTTQAMKTRFLIHFLGQYYKSSNTKKWDSIFEEDLGFVKLFAHLRKKEFRGRLTKHYQESSKKWIAGGFGSILPWIGGFQYKYDITAKKNKFKLPASLSRMDINQFIKKEPIIHLNIDLNKDVPSKIQVSGNELDYFGDDLDHYSWIGCSTYPSKKFMKDRFGQSLFLEVRAYSSYINLSKNIISRNSSYKDEFPQNITNNNITIDYLDGLIKQIIRMNYSFFFMINQHENIPVFLKEQQATMDWFFEQVENVLKFESFLKSDKSEEEILPRLEGKPILQKLILKYIMITQNPLMEKNQRTNEILNNINSLEGFCTKLVIQIIGSYYKHHNYTKWRELFETDSEFVKLFVTFKRMKSRGNQARMIKTNQKYWKSLVIFPWENELPVYELEVKEAHKFGLIAVSLRKASHPMTKNDLLS